MRQERPLSAVALNTALEVPGSTLKQEKNKGIRIGKEKRKSSSFPVNTHDCVQTNRINKEFYTSCCITYKNLLYLYMLATIRK